MEVKINNKTNISKLLKRWIRKSAGANNNTPIHIVEGSLPPKLCGKSGYYINASGDIIHHPNAYRKAWGKPIYIRSTIRVEVGSEWLLNNMSIHSLKMNKLKCFL